MISDYEKLGAFYLGRRVDPSNGELLDETILYDSKDLTTHAVCVGMTGSGKTGLCISLLEEAAIDGIPVLAIDPKGDLGNLGLTFPELRAADFAPWIDQGEAMRKGRTIEQQAEETSKQWRKGLAEWGQDGARITRLREAADFAIYTPGSDAGLKLSALRSFVPPPESVAGDGELWSERILAAVSGLLALVGIDADPVRSREHVLLSNLLDHAWRAGRELDLPELIRGVQSPPFSRIGVLDVDTFIPPPDRTALAMAINGLLASPGFATWMEGEPLDIQRLLWTPSGKPRVSVLSIAHLSEAQRMFFVTLLLSEFLTWTRSQSGTSSLRAILYMDEVFGYLPPTANPPSKRAMLTLLKQARAFGVGVVLATQNPVDLDYKALSNAGTWFLGRLQTERDKLRVLDGLEGASAQSGTAFDRASMERTLAGLSSRTFVLNNVHDDAPVVMRTRWAMSYLRGPLTRSQIAMLMQSRKAGATSGVSAMASPASASVAATTGRVSSATSSRPLLPSGTTERFARPTLAADDGATLLYRAAMFGSARLHFVSSKHGIDEWREVHRLAALAEDHDSDPFDGAHVEAPKALPRSDDTPRPGFSFDELPAPASSAKTWPVWTKAFSAALFRDERIHVHRCAVLKTTSEPGESVDAFRARCAQAAREARDVAVEELRRRFAPKIQAIEDRIRRAEDKVEREEAQVAQQKTQTAISIGSTILGAIFGRRKVSASSIGRAGSAIRSASRVGREKADVARAEEAVAELRSRIEELDAEFERASEELRESYRPESLEITTEELAPRKADTAVLAVGLCWVPWQRDRDGRLRPLLG
ncbi:MAG: DUF87 domain-containing protein [Planctomycetota bacterium]